MKTKDGEYVELDWVYEPEFELVRGWPGEAATRKAVESFACNDFSREWTFKECYAASLQTNMSRCQGWQSEIRLYNEPGRGRYKVSVLLPPNMELSNKEPNAMLSGNGKQEGT